MTVRVTYWGEGGETAEAEHEAGTWDVHAGALLLYGAESKKILVAYGPHHWIRAEWSGGR